MHHVHWDLQLNSKVFLISVINKNSSKDLLVHTQMKELKGQVIKNYKVERDLSSPLGRRNQKMKCGFNSLRSDSLAIVQPNNSLFI